MYTYECKVIEVHDGDTVHALIQLGLRVSYEVKRLRLDGIDSPELRTPPGPAARDYLAGLLKQGSVVAKTRVNHEFEKFGGVCARLYVTRPDGTVLDVSQAMLDAGHAVHFDGQSQKTLDQHTGQLRPAEAPR